jgi:hypothetical protein
MGFKVTMKIVLCTINAKWIHPSLALRLLKANLGVYEADCAIVEFALRQRFAEQAAALLAARPRVLGFSVAIWNHTATRELLGALETAWQTGAAPHPVVVLGGPEVSFLPEDAEIFRHAAYVIRGEGEQAFRELCGQLLSGAEAEADGGTAGYDAIPGGTARFINAARININSITTAYHYYTDEDLRRKLVYVEASRGCPYTCAFCLSPAESAWYGGVPINGVPINGGTVSVPPVREFPLDAFLAAMGTLIGRGARDFKFLDRTFNLDTARAVAIMEFFLERIEKLRMDDEERPPGQTAGDRKRPLCVHFEITPSRFPEELRRVLARFPPGSLRLEVGIQTFNRETAALIRRPLDEEVLRGALEFLGQETRAIIHADLIAALPGEGWDSFAAGFDTLWTALSPRRGCGGAERDSAGRVEIQVGILKLLPGAAIVRYTARYGMRYSPSPPYEAMETAALPRGDLDRIKNYARFWELIMNRGVFPEYAAELCPPGEAVFYRFMGLADNLFARFGRNWGLDRRELREALTEELSHR